MRVGLVRNVGLSITALAVLALGGCDSNPLSFNVKDTVGIQVNPSEMVVAAGRTADLESRAVNQGNEPTFDAVSAAVDPICGQGSITVIPDPEALEIQPPGLFVVTGGAVLGQTCVVLTSGSNTAQVDVTVVADAVQITAPGDGTVYRAGEGDQVIAQLIDFDGNTVGPYAPEDATFTSSNTAAVSFTDDVGTFTTAESGSATLTATWAGQDLNGTSGLGVVRSADILVEVIANVPASIAVDFGEDTSYGAHPAGEDLSNEIVVFDALGNQNTDETEITGCTAVSSNPVAATVACELVPGSVNVFLNVSTLAAGASEISGTVTTSEGVFDYGPHTIDVLNPIVTGMSVTEGAWAETITITGTGFIAAGYDTNVRVDGLLLGNITVVSDTEITAQMPTFGTGGVYPMAVDVGGVLSNEMDWTQNVDFNIKAFEPANDIPETAVVISIPAIYSGTMADGTTTGDLYDFVRYTVSSDVGVQYAISWVPGKDLDGIEFTCFDSADVFSFACYSGTFIDPSGGTAVGAGTAGDWLWTINDYDAEVNGSPTAVVYTVEATVDE